MSFKVPNQYLCTGCYLVGLLGEVPILLKDPTLFLLAEVLLLVGIVLAAAAEHLGELSHETTTIRLGVSKFLIILVFLAILPYNVQWDQV